MGDGRVSPPFHSSQTCSLLKDSLSGAISTCWIFTVEPTLERASQTRVLLEFASQMKAVSERMSMPSSKRPTKTAPNRPPPDPPKNHSYFPEGSSTDNPDGISTNNGVDQAAATPPEGIHAEINSEENAPRSNAEEHAPRSNAWSPNSQRNQISRLTAELAAVCEMCESLRAERDKLQQILDDNGEYLRGKARSRLARAEQDVKDYEMFEPSFHHAFFL